VQLWNRMLIGLHNVNIACDWVSHGGPHSAPVAPVFDWLEIFLPRLKWA